MTRTLYTLGTPILITPCAIVVDDEVNNPGALGIGDAILATNMPFVILPDLNFYIIPDGWISLRRHVCTVTPTNGWVKPDDTVIVWVRVA